MTDSVCNYRVSSYSFRGNYSFLDLEIQRSQYIRLKVTVYINVGKLFKCGNYMRKYGTFFPISGFSAFQSWISSFSWSLGQFFLTGVQNNFRNKKPKFQYKWPRTIKANSTWIIFFQRLIDVCSKFFINIQRKCSLKMSHDYIKMCEYKT